MRRHARPGGTAGRDGGRFPILDLAEYVAGQPGARERLADALRDALENIGFLLAVNHGVPQPMIDNIFAQAAQFHALPPAQKLPLRMASGSGIGYRVPCPGGRRPAPHSRHVNARARMPALVAP